MAEVSEVQCLIVIGYTLLLVISIGLETTCWLHVWMQSVQCTYCVCGAVAVLLSQTQCQDTVSAVRRLGQHLSKTPVKQEQKDKQYITVHFGSKGG